MAHASNNGAAVHLERLQELADELLKELENSKDQTDFLEKIGYGEDCQSIQNETPDFLKVANPLILDEVNEANPLSLEMYQMDTDNSIFNWDDYAPSEDGDAEIVSQIAVKMNLSDDDSLKNETLLASEKMSELGANSGYVCSENAVSESFGEASTVEFNDFRNSNMYSSPTSGYSSTILPAYDALLTDEISLDESCLSKVDELEDLFNHPFDQDVLDKEMQKLVDIEMNIDKNEGLPILTLDDIFEACGDDYANWAAG